MRHHKKTISKLYRNGATKHPKSLIKQHTIFKFLFSRLRPNCSTAIKVCNPAFFFLDLFNLRQTNGSCVALCVCYQKEEAEVWNVSSKDKRGNIPSHLCFSFDGYSFVRGNSPGCGGWQQQPLQTDCLCGGPL